MSAIGDRLRSIASGYGIFGIGRALPVEPHWTGEAIPVPRLTREEIVRPALLFLLTVLSTWFTLGWQYSAAIMTILLCHEMGHYLMCRRYRVAATLPLFIPMPYLSLFGTMGAVIRMKANIRDRRVLFDIGIAGPLAGLVPALIALLYGLQHSRIVPIGNVPDMIPLGDSLLLKWSEARFFPHLGAGEDVLLHPIAFAGWAGLFVTALNLLPVGQLDGGHVLYGLVGKRSHLFATLVLIAMGVNALFYPGWWFWFVLLLLFGVRHPRTLDEDEPLGWVRVGLGIFALIVFVLCFVPQPFTIR